MDEKSELERSLSFVKEMRDIYYAMSRTTEKSFTKMYHNEHSSESPARMKMRDGEHSEFIFFNQHHPL